MRPGNLLHRFGAAALALAGLGALPKEKEGAWLELKTAHFTVVTNGSESDARATARRFEQIRAVFQSLFPAIDLEDPSPYVVVGAKDETTLKSLIPELWVKWNRPGAMHMPDLGRTFMVMRVDTPPDREDRYSMAYWGYATYVLGHHFRTLPLWASRGLADFYAYTTVREDRVLIGRAAPGHIQTLREAGALDLELLLAVDRTSPHWNDQHKRRVFDAQSWALVHYLLLGEKGAHRERFSQYVQMQAKGASEAEAGRAAFGDLRRLRRGIDDYIRSFAFYMLEIQASFDASAKQYPVRKLSVAEAYALRGAVHVAAERFSDAREALGRAIELDPKLAAAHESVAVLAYKEKKGDEAVAAARRALDLDAQSPIASQLLGWLGGSPEALVRAGWMDAAAMIRLLEAECERGVRERCRDLARSLLSGGLGPRDASKGPAILARLCDSGDKEVCQELLWRYESGQGVEKDPSQAAIFGEKLCGLGDLKACLFAANVYRAGGGASKDPAKAAALFEAACTGGETSGCIALAMAYEFGDGLPTDMTKAAVFHGRACDAGDGSSCVHLGVLHMGGQGLLRNPGKAAEAFAEACDKDQAVGCSNLAALTARGQGVPRDVARAKALYEKACRIGHPPACAELKRLGR